MANIQADIDPVSKFKALVPRLKESLSKLMEVAAIVFYQNSLNDNCSMKSDVTIERFDKSLEEFYGICDQIELLLKLAQECNSLHNDSIKHTPIPVQFNAAKPPEPTPQTQQTPSQSQETQSFSQYIQSVKSQIRYAQETHDLLIDCSKRLSEPLVSQQQQQQQSQHAATVSAVAQLAAATQQQQPGQQT